MIPKIRSFWQDTSIWFECLLLGLHHPGRAIKHEKAFLNQQPAGLWRGQADADQANLMSCGPGQEFVAAVPQLGESRAVAAYLARRRFDYSARETAEALGYTNTNCVSRAI